MLIFCRQDFPVVRVIQYPAALALQEGLDHKVALEVLVLGGFQVNLEVPELLVRLVRNIVYDYFICL